MIITEEYHIQQALSQVCSRVMSKEGKHHDQDGPGNKKPSSAATTDYGSTLLRLNHLQKAMGGNLESKLAAKVNLAKAMLMITMKDEEAPADTQTNEAKWTRLGTLLVETYSLFEKCQWVASLDDLEKSRSRSLFICFGQMLVRELRMLRSCSDPLVKSNSIQEIFHSHGKKKDSEPFNHCDVDYIIQNFEQALDKTKYNNQVVYELSMNEDNTIVEDINVQHLKDIIQNLYSFVIDEEPSNPPFTPNGARKAATSNSASKADTSISARQPPSQYSTPSNKRPVSNNGRNTSGIKKRSKRADWSNDDDVAKLLLDLDKICWAASRLDEIMPYWDERGFSKQQIENKRKSLDKEARKREALLAAEVE